MRSVVVSDTLEPCPYIEGQTARLPLRMPVDEVSPSAFDQLLERGHRRYGPFFYRTACPSCSACEAIRVPVARFTPTRSQKRVARRNADVVVSLAAPSVTARHLEIYNRHQFERNLARTSEVTTEKDYSLHLLHTCVDTSEVRYVVDGRLMAISILDFGATSASSVYHAFDPDESARSLGVYSVMKEIELCRARGIEWYYLGLYVGACKSLAYKANYFPHERCTEGEWRAYAASDADAPAANVAPEAR